MSSSFVHLQHLCMLTRKCNYDSQREQGVIQHAIGAINTEDG